MKMLRLLLETSCVRWQLILVLSQSLLLSDVFCEIQLTVNQSKIQRYVDEKSDALDRLLEGYDKRFIPAIPGMPLTVDLQVVVSDVLSLDDKTMDTEMILYIRQTWYDHRLIRNSTERIKVREHCLDKIWLPDIRMRNIKDIKRFDGFGGINMNIHPDGRVYFSQLVLVKISCPMDLREFPMDKQTCYLNFSSYAYGKSLLIFSLAKKEVVVKSVLLPTFDFVLAEKIFSNTNEGTQKVTIALTFHRRWGYYILQIYVPSVFLVVLSWLAFLMESSDIADRLALEVTMILSIVFLLGSINTPLPHVSYAKASDWFVMVSFGFIFLALLETMLVYRMTSSPNNCKPLTSIQKCLSTMATVFRIPPSVRGGQKVGRKDSGNDSSVSISENVTVPVEIKSDRETTWSKIFWVDKFSIFAFPILYTLFNSIYWNRYL